MGQARLAVSGDNRWRRSRWGTEGTANQRRKGGDGDSLPKGEGSLASLFKGTSDGIFLEL